MAPKMRVPSQKDKGKQPSSSKKRARQAEQEFDKKFIDGLEESKAPTLTSRASSAHSEMPSFASLDRRLKGVERELSGLKRVMTYFCGVLAKMARQQGIDISNIPPLPDNSKEDVEEEDDEEEFDVGDDAERTTDDEDSESE